MDQRNLLADAVFKEFIDIANNEIKRIYLVDTLRESSKRKRQLYGELDENKKYIFISDDQDNDGKLKTLIHELAHYFFHKATEKEILRLENYLWENFSKKQKAKLYTYIPRIIRADRPT